MGPARAEHFVVYRDDRYFCGWPFNGGFWQFADGELAVGFIRGACDYGDPRTLGHAQVDVDNGEQVILRSSDGGRTWPVESMTSVYKRPAFDEVTGAVGAASWSDEPPLDPSADGYCLLSGYGIPIKDRFPDVAWAMASTDRGETWLDPVRLPSMGFANMGGRPSYLVRPDGMLLLFLHASWSLAAEEGGTSMASRPIVMGSADGGRSWGLIAEVSVTPENAAGIMPYPLQLPDGRLFIAVRRQYKGDIGAAFTQVYVSEDGARTWRFLSRVNDWGAPANLVRLPDGRVVCVYGCRRKPWGVRACISEDACETWGEEIVLRDDGGSPDLGYPRTHLRPDGALVTVYYFNDAADPIQTRGGVRYIAATVWRV